MAEGSMGAVKLGWRSDILNKAGLGPGIDTLYIAYVENARPVRGGLRKENLGQ